MNDETGDPFWNRVDAFTAKLERLAEEIGPDAVEAVLTYARADAVAYLLGAWAVLVLAAVGGPLLIRFLLAEKKRSRESVHPSRRDRISVFDEEARLGLSVLAAFAGLVSIIAGTVALVNVLHVPSYIAVVRPEVWIVGKIVGW